MRFSEVQEDPLKQHSHVLQKSCNSVSSELSKGEGKVA
jgi:hypothetical protein